MSIRTQFVLFAFALTTVGVVPVASAQESVPPATTPQAPAGYVLIEEEHWYKLADEPERHIARAREAYLMMDVKTAAAELRKAAIHVRIAANHANERGRLALIRSEHELEHAAKKLESGSMKTVEELDFASARALHALSNYQYVKAAESWRKRETRMAGQYLRAAANNLEYAAARTDAKMRAATTEVVKDSRIISGKLIEGTGYVVDEVGDGIDKIGTEIERVGSRVLPPRTF